MKKFSKQISIQRSAELSGAEFTQLKTQPSPTNEESGLKRTEVFTFLHEFLLNFERFHAFVDPGELLKLMSIVKRERLLILRLSSIKEIETYPFNSSWKTYCFCTNERFREIFSFAREFISYKPRSWYIFMEDIFLQFQTAFLTMAFYDF